MIPEMKICKTFVARARRACPSAFQRFEETSPVFGVYSAAMNDDMEAARAAFAKIKKPSTAAYEVLIDGYARQGDLRRAAQTFADMETERSMEADVDVCSTLLLACREREPKAAKFAVAFFRQMVVERLLTPDRGSIEYLIDTIGFERARALCEELCVDFDDVLGLTHKDSQRVQHRIKVRTKGGLRWYRNKKMLDQRKGVILR